MGSNTGSGLEKLLIEILENANGPMELKEIYTILRHKGVNTTTDSVRKTLERLALKGIVKRVSKGLYSYVPHKTLDVFTSPDTLTQQVLDDILHKVRGSPIIAMDFLEKLKALKAQDENFKIRKANPLKEVEKVAIGGSAADDSSRPIRVYASWSGGSFVRVSGRIRIAGIASLDIHLTEDLPKIDLQGIKFLPEHIEEGGSAEFVLERFKRPFIEKPTILRDLDIDFDIAQEFARKISDYELIEFNQDVIELALAEAKRKSTSSDIAIAFIDGSILPGHLDPKIYPSSKDLDKWPPDMAKQVLKRKERILRRFLHIYEYARLSENIILVGAIKNSNDMSLQASIGAYYDAPDQALLMNAMKEGEILGPFRKHRVEKVLLYELRKFNIEHTENIAVDSFYIKKRENMLPPQLDIVFPENMEEKIKDFTLDIIYHLTVDSEKHTKIASESISTPTLGPLRIVDMEVSKRSLEIVAMINKELGRELFNIMEALAKYAGIGISIYVLKLDSWRLERLM
jgi:predicted transcriptional regulator